MNWLATFLSTTFVISSTYSQFVEVRVSVQLPSGDHCVCDNGTGGQCKLLRECPSVYLEVLQGRIPRKTCGFAGLEPIVCCPENNVTQQQLSTTPTTTIRSPTTQLSKITPDNKIVFPTESQFDHSPVTDDCSTLSGDSVGVFSRFGSDENPCVQYESSSTQESRLPIEISSNDQFSPIKQSSESNSKNNVNEDIFQGLANLKTHLVNVREKIDVLKKQNETIFKLDFMVTSPKTQVEKDQSSDEPAGLIALKKCQEHGQYICPKELSGYFDSVDDGLPHMAAIGYKTQNKTWWLCTGTIVSAKFVLASAHCQYSPQYGWAVVAKLGQLGMNFDEDEAKPQDRNISMIFPHPLYKYPSDYHDIALYKLDEPIIFSYFIRPACLSPYPTNEEISNNTVLSAGWKIHSWDDAEKPKKLMEAELQLVDSESCNKTYFTGAFDPKFPYGIVDEWQICAGKKNNACQGNSESQLLQRNREYTCLSDVIGVCNIQRVCDSNVPGIYARVNSYLPWLEKEIWGDEE